MSKGKIDMSVSAREALTKARAVADTAYEEWMSNTHDDKTAWQEIGYGIQSESALDPSNWGDLVKTHWGKLVAVTAAFGIPLGVADVGAFKGVLGVISNFWPF